MAGLDPVEDGQLPDDEDDAGEVEENEKGDNSQECGQLLMLIILGWDVFLHRIFVDQTEESDVCEAHYNHWQYRPERMRIRPCNFFPIQTGKTDR